MSIVVVGSLNVDLTCAVPRLPAPGETVLGGDVAYDCGGKGGNQAVAAARLAPEPGAVTMVGLVGDDDHGAALVRDLRDAGARTDRVTALAGVASGLALICVDGVGENTVVVSPGANARWRAEHVADLGLGPDDVLVVQLEIPVWVVAEAVEQARAVGARVVLNAAPPTALPRELVEAATVLVVNESEGTTLLGGAVGDADALRGRADGLPCAVVVTLGSRGALLRTPAGDVTHVPAFEVRAVSSVGAGDAFVGCLAVDLHAGRDVHDAVLRAAAAGALAASADGARGGMPTADQLATFLEDRC